MAFLMKTVLVGDPGVGKTTYIKHLCSKGFNPNQGLTTGFNCCVKDVTIRKKSIRFQFWELLPRPGFNVVHSVYYYGAHGGIIMFDVSRPETFSNLKRWVDDVFKHNGKGIIPIVIVGNKIDLLNVNLSASFVSDAQIQEFCIKLSERTMNRDFSVKYFPISIETNLNLLQPLDTLGNLYLDYLKLFQDRTDPNRK
ncbi:MAG: Rab family GTPase [Candidatus Hodarchaeales archaeon]|jgi:small GTP-binding protein